MGMVLLYGMAQVDRDWHVKETSAAGCCRLYWVQGGTVRYEDPEQQTLLQHGRLYLFPSTVPYEMTQDRADPLRCLFLHLNVSPGLVGKMTDLEVREGSFLHRQLQSLEQCIPQNEKELCCAVGEVLETLFRRMGLIADPDPALSEVLCYMADHLQEPLTLEELSALAGYHPQYFVRYFKKRMGITPYRYLLDCRMQEAQRRLLEGAPVTAAAAGAGYRELKTFEQTFRSRFGTSPGLWRSSFRAEP